MSVKEARKRLKIYSEDCIDCGICEDACPLLSDLGLGAGEIARQVLDGSASKEVVEAIKRCDLCGLCSRGCLVNLDPSEMVAAAREILVAEGKIDLDDYQVMLVDRDWNFFTIYRNTFGIKYDDLQRDAFDTLFFPGCTLSSYSPELNRAAFQWLAGQGYKTGFSELCCGKPLSSIGLKERKDGLLAIIAQKMTAAGASRLVTACPNCYYQMRGQMGEIEVISIYHLFRQAGVQLKGDERLTIHDSCPDRKDLSTARDMRGLLAQYPITEMEHNQADTLCCGSGGIVSMIDPDLCSRRAQDWLKEFAETGADTCVTACMSCAHRLSRAVKPGSDDPVVTHLLELVFGIRVDYSQVHANTEAMWQGRQGEINLERLSQARALHEGTAE
jgi:fumarate reductase (CoM/CoB) subunit B